MTETTNTPTPTTLDWLSKKVVVDHEPLPQPYATEVVDLRNACDGLCCRRWSYRRT
jgi:hypothetical protein